MMEQIRESVSHWATEFIKNVGFPIAVSCVVLWFGFDQIKRNEARTEKMTDFALTTMKSLVESNTQAITHNSVIVGLSSKSNGELTASLERLNQTIESLERKVQ